MAKTATTEKKPAEAPANPSIIKPITTGVPTPDTVPSEDDVVTPGRKTK